jgi:general nucleoside transport system permease protein
MTSGRGFIGLTAALFGAARPWPTGGASFLFGGFGVIADQLQLFQAPSQFVLMAPYLAALLALILARWRALTRARPAPVHGKAS